MEECEICGRKTNTIYIVNIDGAEFRVCKECARGRKIIKKVEQKPQLAVVGHKSKYNEPEYSIIEGYGRVIREARERMQLPIKTLAEMLNEKESFLLRVEEEKTEPSEALAKKLEKLLNIKLLAQQEEQQKPEKAIQNLGTDATLEEFIKIKKKK
ncbi:MAG: helix-turn-helix domain-containing protein [Candidatus Micrarchaeia archaeon]